MSLPDNPMPSSVPAVDQTLVLSDGRTLGYALWGEPGGTPVLLVGTSPGSRLLCPDLPATLAAGVRLVTVDRPGSGRSDPDLPGMARWVADTGALVDHLRLERFGAGGLVRRRAVRPRGGRWPARPDHLGGPGRHAGTGPRRPG